MGFQVFEYGIPVVKYQLAAWLRETDGPFIPKLLQGGGGGYPQEPHGFFTFNPFVVLDALFLFQAPHDLLDQGVKGLGFEADDVEVVGKSGHGVKIRKSEMARNRMVEFPVNVRY